MASKNVIKLAKRLKKEFGLDVDVNGYIYCRNRWALQGGGTVWEF